MAVITDVQIEAGSWLLDVRFHLLIDVLAVEANSCSAAALIVWSLSV
jgi:hypothetical protein